MLSMRGAQHPPAPVQRAPRGETTRADAARQLSFGFDGPGAPPLPVVSAAPLATAATGGRVELVSPPEIAAVSGEEAARAQIEDAMRSMLGVRVQVELTSNRRTMISSARDGMSLRLRLHRMFVEADGAIVEALGRYVKTGDRRASRRLGEFIEQQRDRFVAPRPPRLLRHLGAHHDLLEIFVRTESTYFPGALEGVTITWGRHGAAARGRRRKRSIRLGTYTHDERLIRVHPVLDQPWVPVFFVEYIVFHEMLHHVEPAREEDGRTLFHTPEFRRRERAYPGYDRALAWERANISKLLTS